MLKQTFGQKQQCLQDEVLNLGSRVEEALCSSVEALKQRDIGRTMHLIADGCDISRKCAAIETAALTLLAAQQPAASDLRVLAAALEVALELERIGDHTKKIASINLKLGEESPPEPFVGITQLAAAARNMLHQTLEAFAGQDVVLARAIPVQDDEVDDLYNHIYRELLAAIKADRDVVNQAIYLSQVAHHLERVADRAIHICQWVIFTVTGNVRGMNGRAC